MKRVSFVIFLIIGCKLYGQQPKYSNTLLWRISGKGLSRPSYLYGTMHLTDKKVFFLGDSVYSAIDRTEGFATELDLNTVGIKMINHFMNEKKEKEGREPVKVKDVVNADIWERYKEALEEKIGKKAGNITVEDLDEISDALESEVFRKGDMPTFLDAHLFGLAKKKGKWVGGIEDIQDQMEHITSGERIENKIQAALYDEEYFRKSVDWFISIYTRQLLDSIDAMYREETGEKDYIMTKRNIKMAMRMDSLAGIRSMFFAVGAAHLPGDSGVISLLRSKGFVVTPVMSSKKIDPSKYVLKSNEETWFPVEVTDSLYFLSMPGMASKFDMLEDLGFNTKVFFDLSFMKLYMTMSFDLGEERKKIGADSLYSGLKNQYEEKGSKVREKKISINGVEGREFRYTTIQGYFVMQVFLPGMERIVVNAIMSFKEPSKSDIDSKKFFQSFVLNKQARKPVVTNEETEWKSYSNKTLSFAIDFPSPPLEQKDVRSEEGKIFHSFQAADLKTQIFYGARISGVKEGLYIQLTDSLHFRSLGQDIRARFDDVTITDSGIISFDGFPACKFSVKAKTGGANVLMDILSILRGNRNYYLFAIYEPGETTKRHSKKFLSSFRFIPMEYPEWKTHVSGNKAFSTSSPFAFRHYKWEEEEKGFINMEREVVYDTIASHTLFAERTIIPSWFWYSSDTALLREWVGRHKTYMDSLIDYRVSEDGRMKIADFYLKQDGQIIISKVKLILQGNEIYDVYGKLAEADLDKGFTRFFDDFTILQEAAPFDLAKPKIQQLSEAIMKGSKNDIEEIKVWWPDLVFTDADIPGLQSLLLKAYPDYDSVYHTSLNWKIITLLQSLDSNNLTVDYIKNNYRSVSPGDNKLLPLFIAYLSGITTMESYKLMRQIISDNAYPADLNMYYYLSMYDSLELTATLYPELLNLARSEELASQVYGPLVTLLDSNLLKKEILISHEKQLIDDAIRVISEKNKDDEVYQYYDLVKLLALINTPEANKVLSQFSKYSDREMKYITIIARLKNNIAVDSKDIYTLATTDDYRYTLYEELRKLKRQALFPSDYLSQEKLSYSKLHIDNYDEEYPLAFTAIGKRIITYKGKSQVVYLFKVYEEADYYNASDPGKMEYYLAVAGPFSTNSKDYYSTHVLTGIYWDEEYNEKKIDQLLKKYIESLEDKDED